MNTTIKNLLLIILITVRSSSVFCQTQAISRQGNYKPQFTIDDPGQTSVFIKNSGQFDHLLHSNGKVSYVINSSDQVLFSDNGYTWIINKRALNEADEIEKGVKARKAEDTRIESYSVSMSWEGASPNAQIIAEEEAEGYYTYADEPFRNLRAKGYRKLIYKDLYPGIDVEYIIPQNKGGIKYSLILKPGADIRKVKMHYGGDVENIDLGVDGNIIIKTPAGNMIDHAPQSFYFKNKNQVKSSFKLTNRSTVEFSLPEGYNNKTVLVIDPWTIAPNLFTGKGPYDVEYDKYGNVYIDFMVGSTPQKISKYSPAGVFLWTINLSAAFFWYSDFCVIPSGSIFVPTGIGSSLIKISSAGVLIGTATWPGGFAVGSMNNEGWVVEYNTCLNILLVGGGGTVTAAVGGTTGCISLRMGVDTALTGVFTGSSVNGYVGAGNDMARMLIDDNGDMFSFFNVGLTALPPTNTIYKSLPPYSTFTYAQPRTVGSFMEAQNIARPSNRLNVMDVNSSYLYFFDGKNLEARNKATGALISSIVVSATYIGGSTNSVATSYVNEGIAVDPCNNVYVGGKSLVHVFNFNGTTFSTLPTMAVPGNVYDIMYDRSKQLIYVTGNGFLSSLSALSCNPNPLVVIPSGAGPCSGNGSASVTVNGGTAPYTYSWSNGGTSNGITAPPGTYTVTVTDFSCRNPQSDTATVTITPSTMIGLFSKGTANCTGCGCKEWIMVTATGGTSPYTYTWPDGYVNRYKNLVCPGNYLINVKDKNGCSINVTVAAP